MKIPLVTLSRCSLVEWLDRTELGSRCGREINIKEVWIAWSCLVLSLDIPTWPCGCKPCQVNNVINCKTKQVTARTLLSYTVACLGLIWDTHGILGVRGHAPPRIFPFLDSRRCVLVYIQQYQNAYLSVQIEFWYSLFFTSWNYNW